VLKKRETSVQAPNIPSFDIEELRNVIASKFSESLKQATPTQTEVFQSKEMEKLVKNMR
jgi:hypothetical protein